MLSVHDITKTYGKDQDTKVLDNISFSAKKGEMLGIMGDSGCGKSTLLNILAGAEEPTSGTVLINEHNTYLSDEEILVNMTRSSLGFLLEQFYFNDALSVIENLMLPITLESSLMHDQIVYIYELIQRLDIGHLLTKSISELTDEQRQKVAIGRAMIHQPDILFLDNPSRFSQAKETKKTIELFNEWRDKYETTIIFSTQDPYLASFCDRVLFIKEGSIAYELKHNSGSFYNQIIKLGS